MFTRPEISDIIAGVLQRAHGRSDTEFRTRGVATENHFMWNSAYGLIQESPRRPPAIGCAALHWNISA
jgi:hypothetical protein